MNEEFLEALRKRAFGYEIEETQTLIEETPKGKVKKVVKVKKHIPPDPSCMTMILRLEGKARRHQEAESAGKEENDGDNQG